MCAGAVAAPAGRDGAGVAGARLPAGLGARGHRAGPRGVVGRLGLSGPVPAGRGWHNRGQDGTREGR
ncbi:hypothetical protein MICRO80W_1060014 [Micrococcus luteus]|nr:hypothetical protein MICRO80W_1060014 [Micrococcus luteus]